MHYVYLLVSQADAKRYYVGMTSDLKSRFHSHNNGQSPHRSKHKPWRLVNYFAFSEEPTAKNFEAYLKTGSGRAFAHKRLW